MFDAIFAHQGEDARLVQNLLWTEHRPHAVYWRLRVTGGTAEAENGLEPLTGRTMLPVLAGSNHLFQGWVRLFSGRF